MVTQVGLAMKIRFTDNVSILDCTILRRGRQISFSRKISKAETQILTIISINYTKYQSIYQEIFRIKKCSNL